MITSIHLERFKRFDSITLRTAELTVLTGMNGAGKTSLIHALLLARQAATLPQRPRVELNGVDSLLLGEAADLLHRKATVDTIVIEVCEESPARWTLQVAPQERSLNIEIAGRPGAYSGVLSQAAPGFTYLCAERFGPRDVLGSSSAAPRELGLGVHGEFTAQVIATCDRERVNVKRSALEGTSGYLPAQVEAWMSAIVRPIEIEARWIPGASVTTLRFKTPGFHGEWTRPPNMGFGVSYALPIVVAGLRAPPGGLLIVENPEAHLHPAAQSKLGMFLARVASDGVQVLVETHSDHVLNGIRRAVADEKTDLLAKQVAIHFFRNDDYNGPAAETLEIKDTGQIASWPAGFFDQTQLDLAELARKSRKKS